MVEFFVCITEAYDDSIWSDMYNCIAFKEETIEIPHCKTFGFILY